MRRLVLALVLVSLFTTISLAEGRAISIGKLYLDNIIIPDNIDWSGHTLNVSYLNVLNYTLVQEILNASTFYTQNIYNITGNAITFHSLVSGVYPVEANQLATKEYVDEAATSLGVRYYMFNDTDGDTGYFLTNITASTGPEITLASAGLSDGDLIATWISPVGQTPSKLISGLYSWVYYAEKTNLVGSKDLRVYWQLIEYKADTSEVILATSNPGDYITDKFRGRIYITLEDDVIPEEGSRIIGKIYANVTGSGNDPDIALYYEDESPAHWEIPLNRELLDQSYLRRDGTTTLTGSWNAGNDITGVTSLTVDNINLDDIDADKTGIRAGKDLWLYTSTDEVTLRHTTYGSAQAVTFTTGWFYPTIGSIGLGHPSYPWNSLYVDNLYMDTNSVGSTTSHLYLLSADTVFIRPTDAYVRAMTLSASDTYLTSLGGDSSHAAYIKAIYGDSTSGTSFIQMYAQSNYGVLSTGAGATNGMQIATDAGNIGLVPTGGAVDVTGSITATGNYVGNVYYSGTAQKSVQLYRTDGDDGTSKYHPLLALGTSASTDYFFLQTHSSGSQALTSTVFRSISSAASHYFSFMPDSVEVMRLYSNDNIKLYTSLDVIPSSGSAALTVRPQAATQTGVLYLDTTHTGGGQTNYVAFQESGSNKWLLGYSTAGNYLAAWKTGEAYTNPALAFHDATGYVSIGRASASYQLHVQNSVAINTNDASGLLYFFDYSDTDVHAPVIGAYRAHASSGNIVANDYLGRMTWSGYQGGWRQAAEIRVIAETVDTNIVSGKMSFYTSNTAGTSVERMNIDDDGKVSTTANVSIGGSYLFLGGVAELAYDSALDNLVLNTYDYTATRDIVLKAKNVGIGTNVNPSYDLQMYDNADNQFWMQADGTTGYSKQVIATYNDDYSYYRSLIDFIRTRGSMASPADVQAGDFLGGLEWYAYQNSTDRLTAKIESFADAVDGNYVAGIMGLYVSNAAGTLTEVTRVYPTYLANLNGAKYRAYSAGNDKYAEFYHDDTDAIFDVSGTEYDFKIAGSVKAKIRADGRIQSSPNGDDTYVTAISHDLTDGYVGTGRGDLVINPYSDIIRPIVDSNISLGTSAIRWANTWSDLFNGADYGYLNNWRTLEAEKYEGYPEGIAFGNEGFTEGVITETVNGTPAFVVTNEFIEYKGTKITPEMFEKMVNLVDRICTDYPEMCE